MSTSSFFCTIKVDCGTMNLLLGTGVRKPAIASVIYITLGVVLPRFVDLTISQFKQRFGTYDYKRNSAMFGGCP